MSNSRSSLLPKLERLILLIFVIAFIIWVIKRCSSSGREYAALSAPVTESPPAEKDTAESSAALPADSLTDHFEPVDESSGTILYVTIDGLNLRTEPSLKSEIILQLELYEEVRFMEEVTPFRDSINLGKIVAYEPWIKIQHQHGRIGWVYGAGVNYYKTKVEGVE